MLPPPLCLSYMVTLHDGKERERERETTPNTVGNHKDVLDRSMDSEERKRLKPVGGGAGKTRFMDGGNQI